MHAFYTAKVCYADKELKGAICGENLGDIVAHLGEYYGEENLCEFTIWLGANCEENVIEVDDILECPFFSFVAEDGTP